MVLGPGPVREELWNEEKERRGERHVGAMETGSNWREKWGKLGLVLVLHPRLAGRRSQGGDGEGWPTLLYRTLPQETT